MKKLFPLLILFGACGHSNRPIESNSSLHPSQKDLIGNSATSLTKIVQLKPEKAYGIITWIDTPCLIDIDHRLVPCHSPYMEREHRNLQFTRSQLIDSLSDPKAYLYVQGAEEQYLIVHTNNRIDTILISPGDAETNVVSGSLSSIQLNKRGNKEIVVDIKSEWTLNRYYYPQPWGRDRAMSFKYIWDIDAMKLVFSATYCDNQHSYEADSIRGNVMATDSSMYKFDVVISEKGVWLKNDSGNVKPRDKMGFYEWRDSAFAYSGKFSK